MQTLACFVALKAIRPAIVSFLVYDERADLIGESAIMFTSAHAKFRIMTRCVAIRQTLDAVTN